jgi:hypothetical protein
MREHEKGQPMRISTCSARSNGRARRGSVRSLPTPVGHLGLVLCLLAMAVAVPAPAQAQVEIHGIGFSKGCGGPYAVGDAYECTFSVANTSVTDTALDTLTFSSIVDVVHSGLGDVPSGNILSQLAVGSITGGASCNASGTNTGAGATGNTLCTVPTGSSITFLPFSHYNVAVTDPNPLTDTAQLTWQDLCTSGADNCPIGSLISTTASQATIIQPDMAMTKSCQFAGETIGISGTVTNTGGAPLVDLQCVDSTGCSVDLSDTSIPVGGQVTFSGSCPDNTSPHTDTVTCTATVANTDQEIERQATASCAVPPPPPNQIPTLSGWVMILLGVFLAMVGAATMLRRRPIA